MKKLKTKIAWLSASLLTVGFTLFLLLTPALTAQEINNSVEAKNYLARFQYIFQYVLQAYVDEVDPKELYEGALNGMFETLDDPYSYYLSTEDLEDMNNTTVGRYSGVGLYISRNVPVDEKLTDQEIKAPEDWPEMDTVGDKELPYIRVVAPIEQSPAYRKGIHAGDYIIAIEGYSTENMSLDDASSRLKGIAGTEVNTTILRGENIIFDVEIPRANIEIPTVKEAMIQEEIGYIRIITFTPYTEPRVKEAVEKLRSQGCSALIIDLRGNGGGLMDPTIEIADMFLSSGPIVSTKGKLASENESFPADSDMLVEADLPIAVLIDEGSASASEILAGALKDTGRAFLIGRTSFGKGVVQKVIPLGREGFKLTVSRYYTPDGVNIHSTGIEPDLNLEEDELSEEESQSLKRLFEERLISNFVDNIQRPSEAEQKAFARRLINDEGITLEFQLLMRLIRTEIFRRMDFPPVYDLEYDPVLKTAVEMLEAGEIRSEYQG